MGNDPRLYRFRVTGPNTALEQFVAESQTESIDPLHMSLALTFGLAADHLKESKLMQDPSRLLWLRGQLEKIIDLMTSASFTAAERADQILKERDS